MNYYAAYGLTFASPFEIKQFIPVEKRKTDVKISFGDVPESLANPSSLGVLWREEAGKFLLDVENVARFLIVGADEIIVELYANGKADEMRRFLLGSVLGVVLHQRQIVILRASAVNTEKGAIIFLGFSGAGKTSFLYSFLQTGGKMLSDEKTPVFLDADAVVKVSAGYPEIALNADVVHRFKVKVDETRVNNEVGKYYYRAGSFETDAVPLRAIYWLENHNGEELTIENIPDKNIKFNILNSFIYLNPYPFNPLQKLNYFRIFTNIVKDVSITRIRYSLKMNQYAEIEKRIREDLVI